MTGSENFWKNVHLVPQEKRSGRCEGRSAHQLGNGNNNNNAIQKRPEYEVKMDTRKACEAPKVNGRADSTLRKPALAQEELAAGPIPRPYPQLGSQPAMPANLESKCTYSSAESESRAHSRVLS